MVEAWEQHRLLVCSSSPYHSQNPDADVQDCIEEWKKEENIGAVESGYPSELPVIKKVDGEQK